MQYEHIGRPGAVTYACKPSTLEEQGGGIAWGQDFKTSLGNIVRPYLYKNQKTISQVWWYVPVILAAGEAEAGRSCTQEAEVAVNWDSTIILQPGQQNKTPTQKKTKVK